jgi:hypothetical protein
MTDSKSMIWAVMTLTLACALLAIAVSTINAALPLPFADQLVGKFMEMFTLGVGAIIGLLTPR